MYEIDKKVSKPKPKELQNKSPIGQKRKKGVRFKERCTFAPTHSMKDNEFKIAIERAFPIS